MAAASLIDAFKKLLFSGNASANNGSIAIAGDVNAPVSLTQKLTATITDAQVERITEGLYQRTRETIADQLPSDQTARTDNEKQIDSQIDAIRGYIEKKPTFALDLLEKLYVNVVSSASGRIRFRLKANIGICYHLLGHDEKASSFLCDAYVQAPEEPKAIANNVLGLVLSGDFEGAFKFGTDQLALYTENETLAGYVVQCAAHLPRITSPLELVPEKHRNAPDVLTAYIYYLQTRGTDAQWWEIARKGAEEYKDNEPLRYYAALAALDEATHDPQLKRTNTLSAAQRERLKPAAAVLKERWQLCLGTDENMRPDQAAIGHNLLSAYLHLRDFDAIRDFASVALANQQCPPEVLQQVGRLSFLTGDLATARTALAKASDSPEAAFLRFHLAAVDEDWAAVAATPSDIIDHFPEQEQEWSRVLAGIAVLDTKGQSVSEQELRELVPLARDSKRALIILARRARKAGFDSLSAETYDKACSLVTPESDYAGRTTVAREAAERYDWSTVITVLDGHVSTETDSEELDMLALAFANITPPREQGSQFFDALGADLLAQHRYALFAGTLDYNRGDLDKAENHFRQAVAAAPHSLDSLIALAQTYFRSEKQDEVAELLRAVDVAAVQGRHREKLHFAQMLARFGRTQDAVVLGYRTLCSAADNAKVNLAYVGLLLNLVEPSAIPTPTVVAPGCWVELENQHQERFSGCIDDGEPDYRQERISSDHPFARGAMGLKVDESFQVDRPVGGAIQWTVQQIINKYVHAMQDVMANYEHRFPDHPGLWTVKVGKGGDDISGLLEAIKQQSENERSKLDLYLEKHLPMAVVAPMLGLDVITLAGRIRRSGSPIISNTGQMTDLTAAVKKLEARDFKLVVLDTYVAWTVVCSGMLPLLVRIFPRLTVARSVLDQLLELHDSFEDGLADERMSLWWADGQFYRDTYTPEQVKEQSQTIRQRIDDLCKACEVLPVDWKEKPAPLVQQIIDAVRSPHILDAAYLAASEKGLLLSEDLFYRQWAGLVFPDLQHAWLQAVLKYAIEAGIITASEYAGAITSLASFRHEYVSVDAPTLLRAYKDDTTDSLERFSVLAGYIGGKNPDWLSHLNVTVEFLRMVVGPSLGDGRTVKAVCTMATNLFRYAGDNWPIIYAGLMVHPRTNSNMRGILELWRKGHFLPIDPVKKALISIQNK